MSHFYPPSALRRLSRRGSHRWASLIDDLSELETNATKMVAFATTMRVLRDALGLEAWLLNDPSNAMDINFILDCYRGEEDVLIEAYQAHLEELQAAEQEEAA